LRDDVVLDGFAIGKKLVTAGASLLSVRGRLARHRVHAADVDIDSELLVRMEADPHGLTLCINVSYLHQITSLRRYVQCMGKK
jgi:hypothetical protein